MNPAGQASLTQEWVTLQDNHERYEHGALIVKLAAIVLFAVGAAWPHGTVLAPHVFFGILCFVVCVLWLQEAILRTSQARLGERLLRIEALVRSESDNNLAGTGALQLHSEWQAMRPGSFGLLREYARNALRPTVAFPYIVLAVVLFCLILCH